MLGKDHEFTMMVKVKTRKLKISLIVSDLSGSGAGRWGGAVRPFLLAQALRQLDYQVELLGIAYGKKAPQVNAPELSIVSVPCQHYSGFFRAASKVIKQIDGDIIYAVKLKPSSFGLALVKKLLTSAPRKRSASKTSGSLSRRLRRPLRDRPLLLDIDDWELSWHGGDEWQYRPNPIQLARDLLQPQGALRHPDHPLYLKWIEGLCDRADLITVHNQFLQQRFGGIYLPNGKDTKLFDPANYNPEASRAKYGLNDYKILMFPGAPRPYKGVEDILSALDKLNRPDLKLAIVGGSPYDDYDRTLQEKWGQWIVQLPRTPVNLMPEIVAAAHVIVVPQRDSTAARAQFPLKLTDGMAMAKPILATRVGDIPNILGNTGYLVAPDSPQQLAEAIESIFDDLDRANHRGMEARQRCLQHYSIDKMSEILEDTISKLQFSIDSQSLITTT